MFRWGLGSSVWVFCCLLNSVHIFIMQILKDEAKHLSVKFISVAQSCPTLCDPVNCNMPGLSVHHQLLESIQTHVHWVGDAIQPSHPLSPLLLLPSIFPSISVFSNELVLRIRWPKDWSFHFSLSPSNEYSGLMAFRIDCL